MIICAGASTLVAGNIKSGVSIFGVNGTFSGWVDSNIYLIRNGVIQVEYESAYLFSTEGNYLVAYINGYASSVTNKLVQIQVYIPFNDSIAPTKIGCDAWCWVSTNSISANVNGYVSYMSSKSVEKYSTAANVFHWSTSGETTISNSVKLYTVSSTGTTTYTYNNKLRVNFNLLGDGGSGYGTLKIQNLWVTRG